MTLLRAKLAIVAAFIGIGIGVAGGAAPVARAESPARVSIHLAGEDAESLYARLHRDAHFEGAFYSKVRFASGSGEGLLQCVRSWGKARCVAQAPASDPSLEAGKVAVRGAEALRLARLIGSSFGASDGQGGSLGIRCGGSVAEGAVCEIEIALRRQMR